MHPGPWPLGLGPWTLELGTWDLELGAWTFGPLDLGLLDFGLDSPTAHYSLSLIAVCCVLPAASLSLKLKSIRPAMKSASVKNDM
jgi:hypothetical protein